MKLKACDNGYTNVGGYFHVGCYLEFRTADANETVTEHHVADYLVNGKKEKSYYHAPKFGERLIGFDSINILRNDNVDTGLNWADQMDYTRHEFDNDVPYRGKAPITYKHYVISPDPRDDKPLWEFQELVHEWTEKWFGEYQCAMVYHNDNTNHITHCHLIVNNTNIVTGGRISTYLNNKVVKELNYDLQVMSLEAGFRAFDFNNESLTKEEMEQRGTKIARTKYEAIDLKKQQAQVRKANEHKLKSGRLRIAPAPKKFKDTETKTERVLKEQGITPWKEEIRQRVLLALEVSASEREFLLACKNLGVEVTLAKSKAKGYDKPEFIFHHPDQKSEHDARQVRGMKLGNTFSRESLDTGFQLNFSAITQAAHDMKKKYPVPADRNVRQNIIENLQVVGSLSSDSVSFDDVTAMLNFNDKHHIHSYKDYTKLGTKEAKQMYKIARAIKTFDTHNAAKDKALNKNANLVRAYIEELDRKGIGGPVDGAVPEQNVSTEEFAKEDQNNAPERGRARK